MTIPSLVFVYGTFMPGEFRWRHIEHYVSGWQEAEVQGKLLDTGSGYPAAIFGGAGVIHGYLLELRPETVVEAVALLDETEGEGSLYRRVTVRTTEQKEAFSYEWLGTTEGLVDLKGSWRQTR